MTTLSDLLYLIFSLYISQRLQLHDIKTKIQHNLNREDVCYSKKTKFISWSCQINQIKKQSCSEANKNSKSNNSYHDAEKDDIENLSYFKSQVKLVYDAWFIFLNSKFFICLDFLFAQNLYFLKSFVRSDFCFLRFFVFLNSLFAQISCSSKRFKF